MRVTALRMGTRASALARAQSGAFADELTRRTGRSVAVVVVRTQGDQLSSEGKAPPGGDEAGVFVRALDDALRRGEIDFAVHSLKDVPTLAADGVVLAAVPERADARDALVVATRHAGVTRVEDLPKGARVATSSPRRIAQLLRLRPDLEPVAISGNVDTRLKRLEEGRADALVLACAGLDRLGRAHVITRRLEADEMLGAPAQGALGVACREEDEETRSLLLKMEDPVTRATASAERDLLQFLRGGCRAPVGASAAVVGDRLVLRGRVLSLDGRECLEEEMSEPLELAERLLARGAARLIDASREGA